ncbi:MAG TPA: hypothetical protein VL346_03845 [Acidobacteriaceae bacterium]|nr:hypothetical protein [Acidobacteriaceae bacterium]
MSRAAFRPAISNPDSLEAAFRGQPTPLPFASAESAEPQSDELLPDAPTPADVQAPGQAQSSPASAAAQAEQEKQRKRYCRFHYCPEAAIDWYMRFINGPKATPMTPQQKGWLAARNVLDPFNLITILGISAISVAADSHSAYGPGFPGWERYVGVSFTEDLTGEFFGTFLICSIAHQDPHYHRLPDASYRKRIAHALYQVAWTQGDNGKGMLNYANLVGAGIDDEIANLYVPGRHTNASATAQRYAIALATAPIDNFITEFLPDVARRIHVQIVVVQRIIDTFANDRQNNGS